MDATSSSSPPLRGRWLALTAALLGWMFDGFEMGLFPVVARPALRDLLGTSSDFETLFTQWNAMINTAFLIGAAAGGVVFGWLGDRLGRIRAMSLSILTYALFSGLGGFAQEAWHILVIRFIAALGMGGEWALGVALVMEVWQGQSRAFLAGVIGAAANAGYMIVALLSLSLESIRPSLQELGLSEQWVNWRLLMVCGALPALLTLFIRLFVPESERWEQERAQGKTNAWATTDLLAVLLGVALCFGLMAVWKQVPLLPVQISATGVVVLLVGLCYLQPIRGYLVRSHEPDAMKRHILTRMIFAAVISGVPLLATWGTVQWGPAWADKLTNDTGLKGWAPLTQIASSCGAIVGCVLGAAFADVVGRRLAYIALCLVSMGGVWLFYLTNQSVGLYFLLTAGLMGATTAAFYGWLPLYLPELFPTRVRATGQGFGFNFGRILAAVGVLQVPLLLGPEKEFARAGVLLALIYLLGLLVIWFGPETRGRPLPE
ncbi:MAG: MFS transporter [Gemmataceae bacterium]